LKIAKYILSPNVFGAKVNKNYKIRKSCEVSIYNFEYGERERDRDRDRETERQRERERERVD